MGEIFLPARWGYGYSFLRVFNGLIKALEEVIDGLISFPIYGEETEGLLGNLEGMVIEGTEPDASANQVGFVSESLKGLIRYLQLLIRCMPIGTGPISPFSGDYRLIGEVRAHLLNRLEG